jgi:uncharacterized protein (TIGR02453 family)
MQLETVTIQKDTLTFLKDLSQDNDRTWFNKHKDRYIAANKNFLSFVQSLIYHVAMFDDAVAGLDAKHCVFRIYRDVRFARDKSPYKINFGATLTGKGNMSGVAGYYLHVQPGRSFLAGGVYMVEKQDLYAIRTKISRSGKEFLRLINNKQFKTYFQIQGDQLVNVPQGFDKEDPMGDFLKYKQLVLMHSIDDEQILSDDFAVYCARVFKAMVPFNAFLNTAARVQ